MKIKLKRIQWIWEYINKYPIIAGILSGFIVLIIGGVIMLPNITDPSGSKRQLAKAQAFLDKGYTERAKNMFSLILKEHYDNNYATTIALTGKAEVYLNQKYFERAIQYANDAIDVNKENGDAYVILGRAYSLMGEHEKAINKFNEALERDTKRKEDSYLSAILHLSQIPKIKYGNRITQGAFGSI